MLLYYCLFFFSISRIHDRKLCILGLCTLISLGDGKPPVLKELSNKIIPCMILLFDGLKRAYDCRTQHDNDEDHDEDEDCDGIKNMENMMKEIYIIIISFIQYEFNLQTLYRVTKMKWMK